MSGGEMDDRNNDDEIRERMKSSCGHFCHAQGLNPWVKACPVCGCENPTFDPEAESDIEPPRWFGGLFDGRNFGE
jgi:hypothetical protein